MSGYLKQKLFQALHDLVCAGDLDQRLTHAGNYLAHFDYDRFDRCIRIRDLSASARPSPKSPRVKPMSFSSRSLKCRQLYLPGALAPQLPQKASDLIGGPCVSAGSGLFAGSPARSLHWVGPYTSSS